MRNDDFIQHAPRTITPTLAEMRKYRVRNPNLVDQITEMVGFPVQVSRLNLVQAAMVWLAWRTIRGDKAAEEALRAIRSAAEEKE